MGERLVGVDTARFVALAGMMAIHVLPAMENGQVSDSQSLAGGRASALFAVLAGVSLALASGGRPVEASRWPGVCAGLLVRAALIAFLGLYLGGLDTRILVILTYYGLLFVVGLPFLLVHTRTLFIAAAIWVVLGPVVSHLIRPTLPEGSGDSPTFESLERPSTLVGELLFTGTYPVFVWLAYLLVGLAVGRLALREWRTSLTIGLVGAGLVGTAYGVSDWLLERREVREALAETTSGSAAALDQLLAGSLHGTTPTDTWWWLAVRSAHSGTPLDLTQTIGSALLVLSVCLAVGRLVPSLARVVFGAGAMTLTLYSAHVYVRQDGMWDAETMDVYVGQVAAALLVGAVFGLLRWRGPLEWVVSRASRLASRSEAGTVRAPH